jgi:TnpA family transposase
MLRRQLLTTDERQAMLGIPGDEESLIRHYTLSPQDRLQAEVRRPHNQLGYAVQLCIMRYPGRILGMDEDPPAAVVAYVAEQLGIAPDVVASYARRIPTRFEHSHPPCCMDERGGNRDWIA